MLERLILVALLKSGRATAESSEGVHAHLETMWNMFCQGSEQIGANVHEPLVDLTNTQGSSTEISGISVVVCPLTHRYCHQNIH